MLELARADGLRIAYSSRWPEMCSYLVKPWLEQHGYPPGFVNWRRTPTLSAADLAATHAAAAARRGWLQLVHNEVGVAAEVLSRFGIAALPAEQLPPTVEGLRRVLKTCLARPVGEIKIETKAAAKKENAA